MGVYCCRTQDKEEQSMSECVNICEKNHVRYIATMTFSEHDRRVCMVINVRATVILVGSVFLNKFYINVLNISIYTKYKRYGRKKAPTISPIKHIEYECKQSKYGEHVPETSYAFNDSGTKFRRKDRISTEYDIRYLQRMFQQNIHIRSKY